MPVAKTVYETSDGKQFDTQDEASQHEIRCDLYDVAENFLRHHGVSENSRVRMQSVRHLLIEFGVALMTPGQIQEFMTNGDDGAQADSEHPQGPDEAGEAQENLEDK